MLRRIAVVAYENTVRAARHRELPMLARKEALSPEAALEFYTGGWLVVL